MGKWKSAVVVLVVLAWAGQEASAQVPGIVKITSSGTAPGGTINVSSTLTVNNAWTATKAEIVMFANAGGNVPAVPKPMNLGPGGNGLAGPVGVTNIPQITVNGLALRTKYIFVVKVTYVDTATKTVTREITSAPDNETTQRK